MKDRNNLIDGFRVFEKPAVETPFKFHSSIDVYERMKDYRKADREIFLVLFMDAKNNCLSIEVQSIGTVDQSSIYPREVMKSALLKNATSLIFVHNHPTGDPDPSVSDRDVTAQLVFCGRVCQVRVLDHIILGEGRYFSFGDEGLIGDYEEKAKLLGY